MAELKLGTSTCPTCGKIPFTRNNYFTGKLLTERDFTDEQRYHREKLRHHLQTSHGWGVVCGLEVREDELCPDRFINISPGSAIDCCGHEMVLREKARLDLNIFESIKTLQDTGDTESHTLQVCIKYRECPTEDIPVLYDDCGCTDTQCAPNRILESYLFDILVDPPLPIERIRAPKLSREHTVPIAQTMFVAVHYGSRRLYLLTSQNPGTFYQVSTDDHTILSTGSLDENFVGKALAVSNDGQNLYIAAEDHNNPADNRQLLVFDTSIDNPLPATPINSVPIPDSGDSDIYLSVLPEPDNRLIALVLATGTFQRWESDINSTPGTPADPVEISTGSGTGKDIALRRDSASGEIYAYTADPAGMLVAAGIVTDETLSTPNNIDLSPAINPGALASVHIAGTDFLIVLDETNATLHLLDPLTESLSAPISLSHSPVDVLPSPDGHWAYVLEKDEITGDSYIQTINLLLLREGEPMQAGEPFKIDNNANSIVLNSAGNRIYAAFNGETGGVAIVDVSEDDCCDLYERHLHCPDCEQADCVVLATIENYNVGDSILDQTDPPADPQDDDLNNIARIDNRLGRKILPSTQVLAEMLTCLCEGGIGEPGPIGPQGPPGVPGADGQDGQDGQDGIGLEIDLTQINGLSWVHNEPFRFPVDASGNQLPVIVISFTNPVNIRNGGTPLIDAAHIFQVLIPHMSAPNSGLECLCRVRGEIQAAAVTGATGDLIEQIELLPADDIAEAAAFVLDDEMYERVLAAREVWVRFRGDFAIDVNGNAVDAEYVRAELPSGDRPAGSAHGIQGGLFESWMINEQFQSKFTCTFAATGSIEQGVINQGIISQLNCESRNVNALMTTNIITGNLGPGSAALAINSLGEFFVTDSVLDPNGFSETTLYRLNASGQGTLLLTSIGEIHAIAFDGNDLLYLVRNAFSGLTAFFSPILAVFDPQNATTNVIGELPDVIQRISGLAFDPLNGDLYASSGTDSRIFRLDPFTAAFEAEIFVDDVPEQIIHDLAFDENGTLFGCAFDSTNHFFEIDKFNNGPILNSTAVFNIPDPVLGLSSCLTDRVVRGGNFPQTPMLNLNTAPIDELVELPGIGNTLARRLVARREQTPFTSIEDLQSVQGVTVNVLKKIISRIRLK